MAKEITSEGIAEMMCDDYDGAIPYTMTDDMAQWFQDNGYYEEDIRPEMLYAMADMWKAGTRSGWNPWED